MRSRKNEGVAAFERLYRENGWSDIVEGGEDETRSGHGSLLDRTVELREWLPRFLHAFQLRSLVDLPCGEINWILDVAYSGIDYTGLDAVAEVVARNGRRHPRLTFKTFDATSAAPPRADLLLCKDMLQHLPTPDIQRVVKNFRRSRCRFLLTSLDCYPPPETARDVVAGEHAPENLFSLEPAPGRHVATVRLDLKHYLLWALRPDEDLTECRRRLAAIRGGARPVRARLRGTDVVEPAWIELTSPDERPQFLPALEGFLHGEHEVVLSAAQCRVLGMVRQGCAVGTIVDEVTGLWSRGAQLGLPRRMRPSQLSALSDQLVARGFLRRGRRGQPQLSRGVRLKKGSFVLRAGGDLELTLGPVAGLGLEGLLRGLTAAEAAREANARFVALLEDEVPAWLTLATAGGLLRATPAPVPTELVQALYDELQRPPGPDPLGRRSLAASFATAPWFDGLIEARDEQLALARCLRVAFRLGKKRQNTPLATGDLAVTVVLPPARIAEFKAVVP